MTGFRTYVGKDMYEVSKQLFSRLDALRQAGSRTNPAKQLCVMFLSLHLQIQCSPPPCHMFLHHSHLWMCRPQVAPDCASRSGG